MKKLILSLFLITGTFASDPFRVPLDGKLYLSRLDESFLEERESREWLHIVKEWEGKRFSFAFPRFPEQKKQEQACIFLARRGDALYQVRIESPQDKKTFLQDKENLSGFLYKQVENTFRGKVYNFHFQDRQEKIFFLKNAWVTLSVLGGAEEKERETFFSSFKILSKKKGAVL